MIADGIGSAFGNYIQFMGQFIAGLVTGLILGASTVPTIACVIHCWATLRRVGWQLALVIISITPLLAMSGAMMGRVMAMRARRGQQNYAEVRHCHCLLFA